MKLKKTLAILAAITMLAMTACGSSSDDEESSKSEAKETAETTVSQSDEEDIKVAGEDDDKFLDDGAYSQGKSAITDSEADSEESDYDKERAEFYAQLDEQYKQFGFSVNHCFVDGEYSMALRNGYGFALSYATGKAYLYNEDGSFMKLSEDGFEEGLYYYFTGDYIYYAGNGKILEINMMIGDTVREIYFNGEIKGATADGALLLRSYDDGNIYFAASNAVLPEDFSHASAEVDHGLTDEIELNDGNTEFIASYKDKMYLKVGSTTYYLDCNEQILHKVEINDPITDGVRSIGKYLFVLTNPFGDTKKYSGDGDYEVYLYDMETDTYVENEVSFFGNYIQNYRGGDTVNTIAYRQGNAYLCEMRLPYGPYGVDDPLNYAEYAKDGDTNYVILKEYDIAISDDFLSKNDGVILSSTHYSVVDEYGIFIHSFEKGSSGEVTVVLF